MEDPPAMISIILVIFVICKLSQFRERKVIVTSRHGSSPPWCSASCSRRYPLRLNWNGRIKAAQNLSQVLKSLIRDCLADNRTIRSNPDQHLSAATIHEGTKGLAVPGKLSRALLEFKLFGFVSSNEVLQLLACHLREFYWRGFALDGGALL